VKNANKLKVASNGSVGHVFGVIIDSESTEKAEIRPEEKIKKKRGKKPFVYNFTT